MAKQIQERVRGASNRHAASILSASSDTQSAPPNQLSFTGGHSLTCLERLEKAVCKRDPSLVVAIKEMRQDEQEEGVPSSALREISLLLELKHTNIVRLYEVANDLEQHRMFLIFEFLDVDLYRLMQANPVAFKSDPRLVKYYTWQILQGLQYLHQRRIIHRDLKPQNLLISQHGNILKLADFGLARAFGLPVKVLSPEVVTIWYRAPELLLGKKDYTAAVDMWSVGCILAEMTAVRPLFPGMREIDQVNRIFSVTGTPTEATWPGYSKIPGARAAAQLPPHQPADITTLLPNLPPDGVDLLRLMLVLDPACRINCKQALKHPYFNDIQSILANPPKLQ